MLPMSPLTTKHADSKIDLTGSGKLLLSGGRTGTLSSGKHFESVGVAQKAKILNHVNTHNHRLKQDHHYRSG